MRIRDRWYFWGLIGALVAIIWMVMTEVVRSAAPDSIVPQVCYLIMLGVSFPCAIIGKLMFNATGNYAALLIGYYGGFLFMGFVYGLLVSLICRYVSRLWSCGEQSNR